MNGSDSPKHPLLAFGVTSNHADRSGPPGTRHRPRKPPALLLVPPPEIPPPEFLCKQRPQACPTTSGDHSTHRPPQGSLLPKPGRKRFSFPVLLKTSITCAAVSHPVLLLGATRALPHEQHPPSLPATLTNRTKEKQLLQSHPVSFSTGWRLHLRLSQTIRGGGQLLPSPLPTKEGQDQMHPFFCSRVLKVGVTREQDPPPCNLALGFPVSNPNRAQ